MAGTRVRVFEDDAGEFRWVRLAGNNRKVASSGEGFERRAYALASAQENFPDDPVEHGESGPAEEMWALASFPERVFTRVGDVPLPSVRVPDGDDSAMLTPSDWASRSKRLMAAPADGLLMAALPEQATAPIVVPFRGVIKPTSPPSSYVSGVKRALDRAGYLWVEPGKVPSPNPGEVLWTALKKFCAKKGIKYAKQYTETIHKALVRTPHAGKPGEWAFDAFAAFMVTSWAPVKPDVLRRERIVAVALFSVSQADLIGYMQLRPMIDQAPPPNVPNLMDCSTSFTWNYRAVGSPDPNGFGFNGWGNTTSLTSHGRRTERSQLLLGDAAFYADPEHVVTYVGDGRSVSHGSRFGPRIEDLDYRGAPDWYRTFNVL